RNQGIPSKPNLNFRAVHKSYSSIFVFNIPWKATVQDLWDSCNQWGVVIDVYIAAKRSKSGHRFGFVRFKNVNDINQLVYNLRVTWMGGFHLFADVTKYGRTNNRLEERSGDNKLNKGMNTQPVRDNANVFKSFNSYAKGNKSMGVSGNNDASNSGEKLVGVLVSNKANKESSNEALMFISEDDCIDLDGMERSILAKVKDLSLNTDLLKYMSSEGFVDVGLRYVGGRWVWLEFDSTDQVESVKNSKVLNELFLELKYVSYDFIPDERCVWIDLVGLPLASWAPEVYKKLGGRWGYDNNDSDSSSKMSSTSRLMREVNVRGVDSDHVDSFEEGKIIGDSVLNNDGCVKDCMKKNLDDDVEKYIEAFSKNVTEKCGVVNNNMSNNVEGKIYEDHFDSDRRNDTIEDNANVNPSTNVYLDVNQNTSIPEVVEDFIVSSSTPSGTVLNLAEESFSTWLDYVGPLITDELDSEKRWSYRDPDENVQGSFSLAQLRDSKAYLPMRWVATHKFYNPLR
nr:hypothetical protein [Tanacetum cinerariifolium]